MRYQGKLVERNDDKAYGFVLPNAGGRKIFVHLNEFAGRRRPDIGSLITFEMGRDASQRSCAVKIAPVVSSQQRRAKEQLREAHVARSRLSLWIAALWVLAVVALTYFGHYSWKLLAIWTLVNGITLVLYVVDKSAAEEGRWRTPEARLHLFALAGGWPAAAFAQQKLRHKTTKESFRAMFWLTVVVNLALMLWLASRYGVGAMAIFH
jgi:uncharacterized membrane protein YsdA (DUF1294 family)/cold shock CspA family protein